MQEGYCIQFERSGGFMGQILTTEVCSNTLAMEDKQTLDSLINKSDFYNITSERQTSPGNPDQYQYVVTLIKRNKKKTINLIESNIPEQLKPLINYLVKNSKPGR